MSANSASRSTGADSPVSVDMSISSDPSRRRASAEIRSPSSISRTSPGTSSVVGIRSSSPSRTTRASDGRYAASASTARSAWSSWTKAKIALTKITTTIAIATATMPAIQARAAAAQRSSASGWVNWRPRSRTWLRSLPPADLVWSVLLEPALGLAPAEAGSCECRDAGAAAPAAPPGSPAALRSGISAGHDDRCRRRRARW